ncbi:MAG TPA: PKD domain-containing protein [Solirubrobacteraceae bacterium]|jgi:hypothetical protein|nr:PKD domain-containing protein [Solirubrobacteraceae bacterium]
METLDSARRRSRSLFVLCALTVIAMAAPSSSLAGGGAVSAGSLYTPRHSHLFAPRGAHIPFGGSQHGVCATGGSGVGQCLIHVLDAGAPAARGATTVTSPTGLAPSTIKGVYGYSTSATAGTGETVAIVDAYNDPNAASDLSQFSAQYGLPAASLTQVNQTGGSSLPATNAGWDLEISLDIEWAHAIAPGASILLVEANSNSLTNLLAAERYAAAHASYVSNSWGASEFSGEASYDSNFSSPGVTFFAAAGDEGGSILWPSASPGVTSVGGTSLSLTSGGTLAQESAWSGGGGGCSRYEVASLAQVTGSVNCAGKRAMPDISLDADPNSGVSVYDSVVYEGQSGWWTVGGTSASTAMLAAETAAQSDALSASYIYANPANIPFRDIILGSNGHPALSGYDLATGLGTWSYTPGAPTALSAVTGAGGVALKWSSPTGAPTTEYVIWRGTTSGQQTTDLATVSGSEYTDSTAGSGVTYYYEVQALNGAGSGPFSAQAVTAPPSTPPVASFSKSCSAATCGFVSTSTDAQGTISSFEWNGGNKVTGGKSTFSDTYSSAGTFTVTLKVINTAGQSASASGKVTCSLLTSGSGRHRRSTLVCT